jgi:hypothetical protein
MGQGIYVPVGWKYYTRHGKARGRTAGLFARLAFKNMLMHTEPERIYNPITAIGFFAMFTSQLDNTMR